MLFGDGAGALVLEAQDGAGDSADRGILASDLNSDGRYKDLLYVDGGVSTGTTGNLRMQGNQVFRHAVAKLAATAEAAMERAGVSADDIDWIVPHQANIRIIQGTAKKMGVQHGQGRGHGSGPRQHVRRVDPLALSVGRNAARSRRGDLIVTRGDRRRSGLGRGGSALVERSQARQTLSPPSLSLTSNSPRHIVATKTGG